MQACRPGYTPGMPDGLTVRIRRAGKLLQKSQLGLTLQGPIMENEQIDVIVPVFNEEDGLPEFVKRLSALPIPVHPIFIDNASTDGSLKILRTVPDATIIEHRHNEGYGASLRDGIRRATASKIVIIDADCEYPPEAIPELAEELDRCDAVYASRFLDKHDQTMPFLKIAGNKIISKSYNILF